MSDEPHDNVLPLAAGEPGSVKKDVALEVLVAHGVSVVHKGNKVILSKGNVIEVQLFPARLHRRMLHRLARRFDIPIYHFYHPEAAKKQQP